MYSEGIFPCTKVSNNLKNWQENQKKNLYSSKSV